MASEELSVSDARIQSILDFVKVFFSSKNFDR